MFRPSSLSALLFASACSTASDPGGPTDPEGAQEPVLGDFSAEVEGFDATVVAAGYRGDSLYVGIRNDGGKTWDWAKLAVSIYDPEGTALESAEAYFWSESGGRLTPADAVAHAVLYAPLDVGARIGSLVVRGPELEVTRDPVYWTVRDWDFGDADSEAGWVEGTVCSSDDHDLSYDYQLDVIVTDEDGRPYDQGDSSTVGFDPGCETLFVGDLSMPADPRILVMPTGY